MKNFLLKTVLVVAVIGIAYVLFFSIEKLDKGKICAVEDLRSKKVVRLVTPFAGTYSFSWEGALPWWFLVSEIPERRVAYFRARTALPELENLREEYYHAWIPLRVTYRIDPRSFVDAGLLAEGGRGADELVKKLFQNELQRELMPYLSPAYQREALAARKDEILGAVKKGVEREFKAAGIVLGEALLTGPMLLPEQAVFNEGKLHAAELRKMDRGIEMGMIESRTRAEKDRLINEQFYIRLKEISKIISANPDILKYIYIDKLGANVNVILSSDGAGVPPMFDKDMKPGKGKPREIDNLK
jgi:hypothetical protein